MGYADVDRAVLDHSDIQVAGGVVHVWARLGNNWNSQAAIIELVNLQLNQLAHIDRNRTADMPGLINGKFSIIGAGANVDQLTGTGRLSVTQSDLATFGPLTALYKRNEHWPGRVETHWQRIDGLGAGAERAIDQ